MHLKDTLFAREHWVVMALWPCAAIANPTGLTVQSGTNCLYALAKNHFQYFPI